MRILVVDDDPSIVKALEGFLTSKGHTIVSAEDGQKGLACLQRDHFDLAFLDLNMPEMDGLQVIKTIREAAIKMHLIMMTIYPTHIEPLARRIGADEYLSKPLEWAEIEAILEKYQTA